MYHVNYFKYVFAHKWFVLVACCGLGIPWRGIIHDWSKFLPCEWLPYVRKFDMPQPPSVFSIHGDERNRMELAGYRFKEDVDAEFDAAWLHHQHVNKHHWQYWLLREDDGATKALRMPDVYMREMLADWRGAGRALGKPDTYAWYMANRAKILLHPQTQQWIENELVPHLDPTAPDWLLRNAHYRASGSARYCVVSIGTTFDDDHFAVIREIRRWRPLRLGWTWAYHVCHSTHPSFVAADIAANCAAAQERRDG